MIKTALKIKLFGDPALRKKARPVVKITQTQRDILSEMAQLMYAGSGIGLAAPQVGVSESLIVVDIGTGLYKLINPRIIKKEGSQIMEEGCLSIPGTCVKINRARNILVEAQDEFAQPVTIEARDLLACVFQHEIDHLKGKLIVDYVSFFDKLKIAKKLEGLKKRAKDEPRPSSRAGVEIGKEGRGEKLPGSETKSCKLQL